MATGPPSTLAVPVARYLVHCSDGGAGMRSYSEPLTVGDLIRDGANGSYLIVRVRPPAAEGGLGHAWAEPAATETAV